MNANFDEKSSFKLDKKLNLFLFLINISKNCIGSYILYIPWAFKLSGILFGLILISLVAVICTYTFCLIAYIGYKNDKKTYSSLFEDSWKYWSIFADASIIGLTILSNAGYLIFIKIRIVALIKSSHSDFNFPGWAIVLLVGIVVIVPLSLIRRLNSYKFLSLISFITLFGALIALIYKSSLIGIKHDDNILFPPRALDFFVSLPIFAGNFDCHPNAVSFFNEYSENSSNTSFKRYIYVCCISFGLVLVLTTIFSTICFVTLGRSVGDDALLSYEFSKFIIGISSVIIFSLVITYALFINSIRISFHFMTFHSILKRNTEMTRVYLILETIGIVTVTILMAIPIKDMGLFNSLIWSIFGSLLIYIFPTFLAIKKKILKKRWLVVLNYCVLFFGVFVSFFMGIGVNIYFWVKKYWN